jgi:GNAT superfamily N-acetyltransferase
MHAQFFASATLPPNLLNWTLNLLESQLKSHYENAPDFGGWNPIEKQQDLLDPTGRFIFLFPIHQETPIGVLYFQFVKEETLTSHQDPSGHCAALYVLELLVDPQYHGQNIGHWFMELAMDLGKGYGMEKVMLTCFKSNARALRFYEKMG